FCRKTKTSSRAEGHECTPTRVSHLPKSKRKPCHARRPGIVRNTTSQSSFGPLIGAISGRLQGRMRTPDRLTSLVACGANLAAITEYCSFHQVYLADVRYLSRCSRKLACSAADVHRIRHNRK